MTTTKTTPSGLTGQLLTDEDRFIIPVIMYKDYYIGSEFSYLGDKYSTRKQIENKAFQYLLKYSKEGKIKKRYYNGI